MLYWASECALLSPSPPTAVVCALPLMACSGAAALGMCHLAHSQSHPKELTLLHLSLPCPLCPSTAAAAVHLQSESYVR